MKFNAGDGRGATSSGVLFIGSLNWISYRHPAPGLATFMLMPTSHGGKPAFFNTNSGKNPPRAEQIDGHPA